MAIDPLRKLGHELRNILSPALMMAERMLMNADPVTSRAGRIVMESIDRATAAIRAAVAVPTAAAPAQETANSNDTSQPWDPARYLQFSNERLRPALDLLAHVEMQTHVKPGVSRRIVDLGCGPGHVSAILHKRWPDADVLGLDNSDAMLAAAANAPGCRFERADINNWYPEIPPDLIYSNAALQWLGHHELLFPRLLTSLAPGGTLAVQMPNMHNAPFRTLQQKVASRGRWSGHLQSVVPVRPILEMADYSALLRPLCATLDLWETTYLHVLHGRDGVMRWAMGTSLRPYLNQLPDNMHPKFLAAYADALRPFYPQGPDGITLLPFRRLFIVATIR